VVYFQVVIKTGDFSTREDKSAEKALVTVEFYDRRRHRDFVKVTISEVVFDSEEEADGFEDYVRWFRFSASWADNTFQ